MVGFKFENWVRLHGLSNAAYNGKLARIESVMADETTGRFLVEMLTRRLHLISAVRS
jgi:hypothetical protein